MEIMTVRERILTALNNGEPDRVPATPDISTMIPIRLTGRPFWDVEINGSPDLTYAYIRAARYFNIDGWLYNGNISFQSKTVIGSESRIVKNNDRWELFVTYHTQDGDLTQRAVSPADNSLTWVEKLIKDFKQDFKKIRHLYSDVVGYDDSYYKALKKEMGEQGMICVYCPCPGFQSYIGLFDGNLEALSYAYYDQPELFSELASLTERRSLQELEIALDIGVDSILTGGSGSITLQSPKIFRELSLPTIKKITKLCKQAGVNSGVHSCWKEYELVKACAEETDLNYVNPLEVPPMGDCDLRVLKEQFGDRIALMGNLHTTEVMLMGSVKDVRRESLKAMRDAGVDGGFVLSTGDQCGRDTPFENILEMVNVAKEFGQYPLDIGRIEDELKKLQ